MGGRKEGEGSPVQNLSPHPPDRFFQSSACPAPPPFPCPSPATLCILLLPPVWPGVPVRPSPGGLSLSNGRTEALLRSAPREAAGLRLEELSRGLT